MEGGGATHKCPIVENPHTALHGGYQVPQNTAVTRSKTTNFVFVFFARKAIIAIRRRIHALDQANQYKLISHGKLVERHTDRDTNTAVFDQKYLG